MGKSIIISSNSPEFVSLELAQIRSKLQIKEDEQSDQLTITVPKGKQSIGVKEMQQLRSWAITKPFRAKHKLGIIDQAELLTGEAQNSVLKLLEEPNQSCSFILVTSNYSKLLPTVISRCELILDPKNRTVTFDLSAFLAGDTLDKFNFIAGFDKIKTPSEKNQQIEAFLVALLSHFREELLATQDRAGEGPEQLKANSALVNQTKKMLEARVPARNCLEYLLINLKFP